MTTQQPTKQNLKVETDDDLDELDDVLNEFNEPSPKPSPSAPPPTATTTTTTFNRPRHNTRVDAPPVSLPGTGPKPKLTSTNEEEENYDEDELSAEFAKELAKGMESLVQELTNENGSVAAATSGRGENDNEEMTAEAFKAAWEKMLIEGLNGTDDGGLTGLGEVLGAEGLGPKPASTTKPAEASGDFQSRIKQTRDKLKESELNLQGNANSSAAPGIGPNTATPDLENLLKSLGDLGLGGEGEGDDELAGFLENMMGQLMSKEILYEPLKELSDNFPGYLANPPKELSTDERTRYEKQFTYVKEIITIFEKPTYSDSNPEDGKKVINLMNEMQNYGSPPAEIMGPLPPGFENGLPQNDENCVIA